MNSLDVVSSKKFLMNNQQDFTHCKNFIFVLCSSVQRGAGRTGRWPQASKAGGIQRMKLKKF